MTPLFDHPLWKAEDLGKAIPQSAHAISMALPRWQDVIGYEEHRPEVSDRLNGGYPRFVFHPYVQALSRRLGEGLSCVPFPSEQSARQAAEYCHQATGQPVEVISRDNLSAVRTTVAGADALKAFWQHTGLIVSSRQAEACLAGRQSLKTDDAIHHQLHRQLADLYDCGADDVFLTPTGMAAHYAALRALGALRPGQPTVQLGFPYVDTYKLQQKLGSGAVLLHNLGRVVEDLHALIHRQTLAGCFAEIPGNPLLGSADVRLISPILREHGVPLVVDDVVATPFNINVRAHADLIATSLTKFLAGTGDVMGGALICNPATPFYNKLKTAIKSRTEELLWPEDAAILSSKISGFPDRMRQHNRNGLLIAERLRVHPAVEKVWYPQWEFTESYETVRRSTGGWGALITFLPRHAETQAARIYDSLEICKGPSLGTVFSLACPFTLLAHYCELDWAESCGIPRNLIRLSIGLEDPEELWQRIDRALHTDPGMA